MNGMRIETLSPPRPFPKSFIGVDNRFHTRVSSPGTGTIVDPHRQKWSNIGAAFPIGLASGVLPRSNRRCGAGVGHDARRDLSAVGCTHKRGGMAGMA